MSEERFNEIDKRLDRLDNRLDGLNAHVDAGFAELRRHMGVLHEEVLDRIAATREVSATVGDADSKDAVHRRLDPLEALIPVVREHGQRLEKHDTELQRLKRRRS